MDTATASSIWAPSSTQEQSHLLKTQAWYDHRHIENPSKTFQEASLVAQWQRNWLPMQETQVRSLVPEDPTCPGASKPVCHNCLDLCSRAWEPQLLKPSGPRACAPQQETPPQWEALTLQVESSLCSPQLEKKPKQQQRTPISPK